MFDRVTQRIWARCCVLLLVLQALTPLGMAQAGQSDRLLLCSAGGTRLMERLPDGSLGAADMGADRDQDSTGYFCPHCASAGSVALPVPHEAKIKASTWSVDVEWKSPSSSVCSRPSPLGAHGARAPPLG